METTHRSEHQRACIRGCTVRDMHYATCPSFGDEENTDCKGCAPRVARDMSLICDRCFGRMRGLLHDAPDLLGRLRSLADPMKAAVLDPVRVSTSSTEPPAPVGADLLDAIHSVEIAVSWSSADLSTVANDREQITYLGELLLDRHAPFDGLRSAWSVQDAMDQWGVERRDRETFVFPVEDDDDPVSGPVREWYDPLLTVADAAKRHKLTQRAVQKWVSRDLLVPVARIRGPRGSVISYFRASAIDKVAAEMKAKQKVQVPA